MVLRSARTEVLLELTRGLDDLSRSLQALHQEIREVGRADDRPKDRAADIAQDEERAHEALRASAERLQRKVQETVGDVAALRQRS